jgi:hypothetical protein
VNRHSRVRFFVVICTTAVRQTGGGNPEESTTNSMHATQAGIILGPANNRLDWNEDALLVNPQ